MKTSRFKIWKEKVSVIDVTQANFLFSDNLPIVRKARGDPSLSKNEKSVVIEKWRNHVSAISTVFSNIGFLIMTGRKYNPVFDSANLLI